jgi:hypothetical protein
MEAGRIKDNKKIWVFFLPVVFYVSLYLWVNLHYYNPSLAIHQAANFSKILRLPNLLHTILFVPRLSCHLIFNGLFPSEIVGKLNIMDRLIYLRRQVLTGEFPLNLIAVCGVVYLIFQGFSMESIRRNKFFILLLTGMAASMLITLALMRLPTHGEYYVFMAVSYYGYMFWSYVLVIICMAVDWAKINVQGRAWLKFLAAVSLVVLIFLNAQATCKLNRAILRDRQAWQQYIDKLNGFIAVHGREPGFSFFVLNDVPIELKYQFGGSTEERVERLGLASILYYPFYNPQKPKYIFFYSFNSNFMADNNFLGSKGFVTAK